MKPTLPTVDTADVLCFLLSVRSVCCPVLLSYLWHSTAAVSLPFDIVCSCVLVLRHLYSDCSQTSAGNVVISMKQVMFG